MWLKCGIVTVTLGCRRLRRAVGHRLHSAAGTLMGRYPEWAANALADPTRGEAKTDMPENSVIVWDLETVPDLVAAARSDHRALALIGDKPKNCRSQKHVRRNSRYLSVAYGESSSPQSSLVLP